MFAKLFYSRQATALATWLGIGTAFFTVLSWLTPEAVGQLTWPQAILAGVLITLITSLLLAVALAIGAWGFRQVWPLSARSDDSDVAGRNPTTIPDYADYSLLERSVGEIHDGLKALTKRFENHEQHFQRETESIRAAVSLSSDQTREQVISLYDALAAVYHRERLSELSQILEAEAESLAQPIKDSFNEEEWPVWEERSHKWHDALERWCEIASCYVAGVGTTVLTVEPSRFKRKIWAEPSQFPDAEALMVYKEFCALRNNWREQREAVELAVHRVACNGGTANERPLLVRESRMEAE